MPIEAKQTKLKFLQYRAYESEERIRIAKSLMDAKFKNSKAVLSWLKKKYPEINDNTEKEASNLANAKTIQEIMTVEGRVAQIYWHEIAKIFNKKYDFISRKHGKSVKPMGAVDPINALFNYGYALLEAQCHRAINASGLDTHVGFMHEVTIGKTPLVYDLQEPFRCLVDLAVINGLEKKVFQKEDFILTENYNMKLRPSGAKKLVKEVEAVFSQRAFYRDGNRAWAYIIMMKANELAQYLIGRHKTLDFSKPSLELRRRDDFKIRQKILSLTHTEAKKLGIIKSELHYLRKKARSDKPFKVYGKVKKRIQF